MTRVTKEAPVTGGIITLMVGAVLTFAVKSDNSVIDLQVLGLPLPWLVLGVLVYPALLLGGGVYLRLAERHERDFTELVERS